MYTYKRTRYAFTSYCLWSVSSRKRRYIVVSITPGRHNNIILSTKRKQTRAHTRMHALKYTPEYLYTTVYVLGCGTRDVQYFRWQ